MSLRKEIQTDIVHNRLAYAVVAAAAVLQVVLVSQPLPFLLANLLPDDAFYYFEIARHIVSGEGSTFDGTNPTNGYHPLWMLILLPLFGLFSAPETLDLVPIRIALSLSVLINIATSILLLRLISRITEHKGVRAFALMAFALNPFVLYETLNGLETSLALLLMVTFLLLCVRASEQDRVRDYVFVGIAAGLMTLARLDMAFYAIAFGGWTLYQHGLLGGFRRGLYAGGIAALVVSPWFLWNYLEFGMLLTSASNGNTLVNRALVVYDNGSGTFVQLKAVGYHLVHYGKDVLIRTGAPWLTVLAILGGLWQASRTRYRALRSPLIWLFGGFCLLFFINAGLRFTGRAWYFISANVFLALLIAGILSQVIERVRRDTATLVLLSIITLGSFVYFWQSHLHNFMRAQVAMYEMAGVIDVHVPPGTPVGVFNAGISGYFSHARIINLDGLVNNAAHEAMSERKLWSYIHEEEIRYLADFELYLTYRYAPFLDTPDVLGELIEIDRVTFPESHRGLSLLQLYEVRDTK